MTTAEEIKSLFLLAFSHFTVCRLSDVFHSSCWYYCRKFSDFSVSSQKGSLVSLPLSPIWAIKNNPGLEDFPSSGLQTLPCKGIFWQNKVISSSFLNDSQWFAKRDFSAVRQLSFIHLHVIYFVLLISIGWKSSYAANTTLGPMSYPLFPWFHIAASHTMVFMFIFSCLSTVTHDHSPSHIPSSIHEVQALRDMFMPANWQLDCTAYGTMGLITSSKIQILAHDPETCPVILPSHLCCKISGFI